MRDHLDEEEEVMIHRSPDMARSISRINPSYMGESTNDGDEQNGSMTTSPSLRSSSSSSSSSVSVSVGRSPSSSSLATADTHKMPTSSSRSSGSAAHISRDEFCRTTFMLPATEQIIEDFGCIYFSRIHIKGRLYVGTHHLCFYSSILGYVTSFSIPLSEVTDIAKRNSAVVLPNAIEVFTRQSSHFFSNFSQRSVAYDTLRRVWMDAMNRRFEKDTGMQFNSLGGSVVRDETEDVVSSASEESGSDDSEVDTSSSSRWRSGSFPDPLLLSSSASSPPKASHVKQRFRARSNVDIGSPTTGPPESCFADVLTSGSGVSRANGVAHNVDQKSDNNAVLLDGVTVEEAEGRGQEDSPVTAAVKRVEEITKSHELQVTARMKSEAEIEEDVQVLDIFPISPRFRMHKIITQRFPVSANEFFSLFYSNDSDFFSAIHTILGDTDIEVDEMIDFRPGVPSVRGIKYRISGKQSVLGSALSGSKSADVLETQRLLMIHNINHTMTYLIVHSTLLPHNLRHDQSFQVEYKTYVTDLRPRGSGEEPECKLDIFVGVASKSRSKRSRKSPSAQQSPLEVGVMKAVMQQVELIVHHMRDQCMEYAEIRDSALDDDDDNDEVDESEDDSHRREQIVEQQLRKLGKEVEKSDGGITRPSAVISADRQVQNGDDVSDERPTVVVSGKGIKRSFTEEELSKNSYELKDINDASLLAAESNGVTNEDGSDSMPMAEGSAQQLKKNEGKDENNSGSVGDSRIEKDEMDKQELSSLSNFTDSLKSSSSADWISVAQDGLDLVSQTVWQFKMLVVTGILFIVILYLWLSNAHIGYTLADVDNRLTSHDGNAFAASEIVYDIALELSAVDVTRLDPDADKRLGAKIRRKITRFLLDYGHADNVSTEDLIDAVLIED